MSTDEQKQRLADLIEDQIEQSNFTMSVDPLLADLDTESAPATDRVTRS